VLEIALRGLICAFFTEHLKKNDKWAQGAALKAAKVIGNKHAIHHKSCKQLAAKF